MIASISLLISHGSMQQIYDEFTLPYHQLTKDFIQSYLLSQYGLQNGYQISYIDVDRDQITVEFDDDYEVAKLTHEDLPLALNVKVNNHDWINSINTNHQAFAGENYRTTDSLLPLHQKTQSQTEIVNQKNSQHSNQQKVEPSLLEPSIKHPIIEQQNINSIDQAKPQEEIMSKPSVIEETQTLIQNYLPNQYKRTETQTSQLESLDQPSQIKAPKKKPTFDFMQDGVPFVQEQSENQKPQILEPKLIVKPKQKKIKQKNPKPSKKTKILNEKDIKKLVKKEVFKLLPQLAEKLKLANQVSESSGPEIFLPVGQLIKEVKFEASRCTVCLQILRIPFYVNSSKGIRMCQECEEKDELNYPLVKIRNEAMLQQVQWAQPLFYVSEQTKREDMEDVKFYSEVKKQFLERIKSQFDERIKVHKENAKREKQEKKDKERAEKSKKQKKEVKQISLI